MKTLTVYYYVVGKTYTEGQVPHERDIEVQTVGDPTLTLCFAAMQAERELKKNYPNDSHMIVRIEIKNYCYR